MLLKATKNEENGFAKFIKGEKPELIHKEFYKKLSLSSQYFNEEEVKLTQQQERKVKSGIN